MAGKLKYILFYLHTIKHSYFFLMITQMILFLEDLEKNVIETKKANMKHMNHFCESKTYCRREMLSRYFGEEINKKIWKANLETVCDNCSSSVGI